MSEDWRMMDRNGVFLARGTEGDRWRVEVRSSVPAQFSYRLVAATTKTLQEAKARAREIENKGVDVAVEQIGEVLKFGQRMVSDNRSYRVCLSRTFGDEEAAREYSDSIYNRVQTTVVRYKVREARGSIFLKNLATGQSFASQKPVLVRGSPVTIYRMPVGVGFHWESRETRSYPETIYFQLDNEGKLVVINILLLETYLRGVVPSEMAEGFPSEALKAQAVAARGEMLAKMGRSHRDDPFDVCADVHCQVYSGMTKWAKSTDLAVRRTKGLVMWKDGMITDAVYSSVCGGHGENNEGAWGGQPRSYLRGDFDGTDRLKRYGSLTEEGNLKRWIDDDPPAFCNTTRVRAPSALDFTKKYFRWQVSYAQEELNNIIRAKTGRNVGDVIDLIPLRRGASGRIIRLRIVGTQDEFIIERELRIRQALSTNTLWSACFYVEKHDGTGRVPGRFVLKGAGFGHGVGMCQTGAAMMALRGYRFDQILKHYYSGVRLRRLY
jgi:SpoIID/LytB domain protein